MAKKMLTVKVEEALIEALKTIADHESRSQGGQIEHWIKQEAAKLKIKIADSKQP